jgi:hypothetical protein
MGTILAIVLIGIPLCLFGLVLLGMPGPADEMLSVSLLDVPRVLSSLSATGKDGSFAVFLFGTKGQPPAKVDALNVQFSLEGGRPGIDWVLLAPLNLESQVKFIGFFTQKRLTLLHKEQNDVKYLRVEGDHLAELLQGFLSGEFGVASEQRMKLIVSGFVLAR